MPLNVGDQVKYQGRTGLVVAVTSTTDTNGWANVTYGGFTFWARLRRAPARGSTKFPLRMTNDPYARLALLEATDFSDKVPRYAFCWDDLPAPTGQGRWVQGSGGDWAEADRYLVTAVFTMTLGFRFGTITIKKGGMLQAGVYCDLVLTYATGDGPHEAWWQPAYPYAGWGANRGRFKTDANGVLWACRPNGTLEEIIVPRGIAALGNRLGDRWLGGAEPERYLGKLEVYYLGEHAELAEGADTTLNVAAVQITVTGPANARCCGFWYGGPLRFYGTLLGGTATFTGLPPGTYTVALYHPSDATKGMARQDVEATASAGSYTVNFAGSFTDYTSTTTLSGRVYWYGSEGLAGANVWCLRTGPPMRWEVGAVTGGDGTYTIDISGGNMVSQLAVVDKRGCAKATSGWMYWDPTVAARFASARTGPWHPFPTTVEGLIPWGKAGGHINLVPRTPCGYLKHPDTGEKFPLSTVPTGNGVMSTPAPRFRIASAGDTPTAATIYQLFDDDDVEITGVGSLDLLFGSNGSAGATAPPWYPPGGAWWQASSEGRPISTTVGGKIQGAVVEASRQRLTSATVPEAARLGLEFGKWTMPLEVRARQAEACPTGQPTGQPTTFTDWECPYCGGPTWDRPSGEYQRGHCMECADQGAAVDCRSSFCTRTLAAATDWLLQIVQFKANGSCYKVKILGWPRPEEYDELPAYEATYLGLTRWLAKHIVLGTWNGTAYVDGESIAQVEARLGRTVGPVHLKLQLTQSYAGNGVTALVTAQRSSGGPVEVVEVKVGPGDPTYDGLYPVRFQPHSQGPPGGHWYTDVTAVEWAGGHVGPPLQIVNDGPAWHGPGVEVKHQKASPWACDVGRLRSRPHLHIDAIGRLWLVDERDGAIYAWETWNVEAGWQGPWQVTPATGYRNPSIAPRADGSLVVMATAPGGTGELFASRDDGRAWERL